MTSAAVHDGNLFMGMTVTGDFGIDNMNAQFGERLNVFLKTALDNITKTSA